VIAREGDSHFAVSVKMAHYLETTMGIDKVHAFHDMPMQHPPNPERPLPRGDERVTIMTGTSFTEDEDLPMIEEAAGPLDALAAAGRIPPITFIVAGDGDRREELERKWLALPLRHVRFEFGWFPQDEYQSRLRQSTIGLSLHRSTNNLDLPTKVSDMIGAGLPMLFLDYDPVLREMIDERSTMFFRTAPELVTAVTSVLENLPANDRLVNMRRAVAAAETETWEAAWSRVVRPIFLELAKPLTRRFAPPSPRGRGRSDE
jgi:beta-1,4-mannosyltransferase